MLRRVGLQRGLLRRHNRLKLASWPSDLLAEALSAQPLRLALRPASAAAAAPLQRRDCEVGRCAGLQTRGFAGGSPPSPSSPSSPSRGKTTDLASYAAKGRKVFGKLGLRIKESSKRVAAKGNLLLWAFVNDPTILRVWYRDIRETVVHFLKWVATGFRLFGGNLRASYHLTKRIVFGYQLSIRERRLLVRTTSDCLKLIPFSLFLIVPFAELALPIFLRIFPNMLPSTFFEQKYDNATMARKFKAKQEMADFWQSVMLSRTREISKATECADKAAELTNFQDKLIEGKDFPSLKEILRFSSLFAEEMKLKNMNPQQLKAMSKMLGLPTSRTWWQGHLEVQLRHHITNLRREDRDLYWEGINGLSGLDLIEACRKRAIRFHGVTEDEMRSDLTRWLALSANHKNIPTALMLWIQSFYLRDLDQEADCELQLQVKKQEEPVVEEASEAFHGMATRQKEAVERAKSKLEELQAEIAQVLDTHTSLQEQINAVQEQVDDKPDGVADAEASSSSSHAAPQAASMSSVADDQEDEADEIPFDHEEKRLMIQHVQKLNKTLKLYQEVVGKQKTLLDRQLKFLVTMRDNKPTIQKDSDVMNLDERVRLHEIIGSFQQSTEDVEGLMNFEDMLGDDDSEDTEQQKAIVKRWLSKIADRRPAATPDGWADLDAAAAINASAAAEGHMSNGFTNKKVEQASSSSVH